MLTSNQPRYRVRGRDGNISDPLTLRAAMKRVRARVPEGRHRVGELRDYGPVQGIEWGPDKRRASALRSFARRLLVARHGHVLMIGDDEEYVAVRKVLVKLKERIRNVPSANDRCDKAFTAVVTTFPGDFESWGFVNTRPVVGGTSWSQHSFWKVLKAWRRYGYRSRRGSKGANAWDIHGSRADMDRLAKWGVEHADELNLRNAIWDDRIWTRGQGWRAYTGLNPHTDHNHWDFDPPRGSAFGEKPKGA
ncbi:MAG: hypothetical protein WD739_07420 [Actinomycetota bacterium]